MCVDAPCWTEFANILKIQNEIAEMMKMIKLLQMTAEKNDQKHVKVSD